MSCQFSINICPFQVDGKYGQPCKFKGCEDQCPMRKADGCLKVPTFAECIDVYQSRGDVERRTKLNVIGGVQRSLAALGLDDTMPYTIMTRAEFNHLRSVLKDAEGVCDYTISTRFSAFSALGARALADEYERRKWQRPLFDIPSFTPEGGRIQEMTDDQAFMIEDWMTTLRLSSKASDRVKFVAMWFIHRMAVRNGDINRMKWSNIEKREDGWYLVYTPHKTAKHARRMPQPKISGRARHEIAPFIGAPDEFCIPRHPDRTPKTGGSRPRHDDATGSHTRMWRDINAKLVSFGIGTKGRSDKKAYCSRKRRITEAFAAGGFQEALKFGQNTPKVQLNHYIGTNY